MCTCIYTQIYRHTPFCICIYNSKFLKTIPLNFNSKGFLMHAWNSLLKFHLQRLLLMASPEIDEMHQSQFHTHTHRVIQYQSNHSFLFIWLLQISITLRQTILHKAYCMFCTTVKPENRLQMFPQILPKTKFKKVLKTKQS